MIINESASGTQEFATAASGLHLMAVELKRIVSGFTIEEHTAAPTPDEIQSQAYLNQLSFSHV